MVDLHFQIRILILIPIWTANQMVTLYYAELFTLRGVQFRFQSLLLTNYRNGIGSGMQI